MTDRLPARVTIEVKTSRGTDLALSKRDIEGIAPDGFAAFLITSRVLGGPRWVLVCSRLLAPGAISEGEAVDLADADRAPESLIDSLNATWSNWVLDPGPREVALAQRTMTLQESIRWCIAEHPARHSSLSGAVRAGKLARALAVLRRRLDDVAEADTGPQQEGFVHQILLEHGFRTLGYEVTSNPVGVPDFDARLATARSSRPVRDRLERWDPASPSLARLRDHLLSLDDDDLAEVITTIGE
jgi:hypothetical protein